MFALKYDLVRAVDDSNRKIRLRYISSDSLDWLKLSIPTFVIAQFIHNGTVPILKCGAIVASGPLFGMLVNGLAEVITTKSRKRKGKEEVAEAVEKLNEDGVDTDMSQVRRLSHIKTTYGILRFGASIEIIQKKHIMLPVFRSDGEEKETKIIQSHVLGKGNNYLIRYGSRK